MRVLLTGGAGFVGSHTAVELVSAGHIPVIVDNLANASREVIARVEELTGQPIEFHEFDLRDESALRELFRAQAFDACIHLAGLKAVGESVAKPLDYYRANIESTLVLASVMKEFGVSRVVFSSSATVYGSSTELPLRETSHVGVGITNPYGQTKYMNEQILKDLSVADADLEVTILRYFNPVGAHPSGRIGEDPAQIPNNLAPYVLQVAVGRLERVNIFGADYPTPDGTGVRDYIHVMDLAAGHVRALERSQPGARVYNLGTGTGTSVRDLVEAFERASGRKIPTVV
ncbi:MAG TPA: UDP-glucose 4-epimerase GalE, partial [Homoserinimonas sp.]|nr:UDP-glucose 4-epimerase GalE [Homoserinimonas sp.]